VTIGPAVIAGEGIACWASPSGALNLVRDEVRAAISDVWGPDRVPEAAQWSPHVSVAYASADAPGEPYEAALTGFEHAAEVTIRAVDLIKLGRDRQLYEWETVTRFPLAGGAG
jgi:hypothetical protein